VPVILTLQSRVPLVREKEPWDETLGKKKIISEEETQKYGVA